MPEHPLKNYPKYDSYTHAKFGKKYEEFIKNLNENAKKEFEFYEVIDGKLQPNKISAEDMEGRTIDYVYDEPKKLMVVFDVDQVLWNSASDRGVRIVPRIVLKVLGELNIGVGIISNSDSFLKIKNQVEKLYGYPILDVHLRSSSGDQTKTERMKKILDANKNTKIMFLDDDVENVIANKKHSAVDSQLVFSRYSAYRDIHKVSKTYLGEEHMAKVNLHINWGNAACMNFFSDALRSMYIPLNVTEYENIIIEQNGYGDVCLSLFHFLCSVKYDKKMFNMHKISRVLMSLDLMYSKELALTMANRIADSSNLMPAIRNIMNKLLGSINAILYDVIGKKIDADFEVNYIMSLTQTIDKHENEESPSNWDEQISVMNNHIHETYGQIIGKATEYMRAYFIDYLKN